MINMENMLFLTHAHTKTHGRVSRHFTRNKKKLIHNIPFIAATDLLISLSFFFTACWLWLLTLLRLFVLLDNARTSYDVFSGDAFTAYRNNWCLSLRLFPYLVKMADIFVDSPNRGQVTQNGRYKQILLVKNIIITLSTNFIIRSICRTLSHSHGFR